MHPQKAGTTTSGRVTDPDPTASSDGRSLPEPSHLPSFCRPPGIEFDVDISAPPLFRILRIPDSSGWLPKVYLDLATVIRVVTFFPPCTSLASLVTLSSSLGHRRMSDM